MPCWGQLCLLGVYRPRTNAAGPGFLGEKVGLRGVAVCTHAHLYMCTCLYACIHIYACAFLCGLNKLVPLGQG